MLQTRKITKLPHQSNFPSHIPFMKVSIICLGRQKNLETGTLVAQPNFVIPPKAPGFNEGRSQQKKKTHPEEISLHFLTNVITRA